MSANSPEIEIKQASSEEAECPSCGASFEYNPATRNLKCPYCEFESEIPDPENEEDRTVVELDISAAMHRDSFNWGAEKKSVICGSCAAESIYDALQIADVCPYCGSNQLMEASAENAMSPNGVIPFEVTVKQAADRFTKWLKGRWFTPRAAKEKATPEQFQGVYLPHWTFDSKTASRYSAQYGIDRRVKDKEGKVRIETDWYNTSGLYQEFIDDHLVLATRRHDERMLSKIRPFDIPKSKAYQAQYLSGYVAERYSVGIDDGWKQAQKEIHSHLHGQIQAVIRRRNHADRVRNLRFSVSHANVTYKYLVLPIWLSSFKYKDKVYHFAVNGQTGKVGGSAPISPLRVAAAVVGGLVLLGGFMWVSDYLG